MSVPDSYAGIPPGEWRGVMKLYSGSAQQSAKEQSEDVKGYVELPFNFDVTNTADSLYITFRNGDESIKVDNIVVALDRSTAKDTITIRFDEYDTYIKAIIEENFMEGEWHVNYKDNYSIPFIAVHGFDYRFSNFEVPNPSNFSGNWNVTFDYDTEEPYNAVGEFIQVGSQVTGTFRTETGDFRYLQGDILENKLKLSVFDGSHAFYFEAKMLDNDELVGIFKSGKHYTSNWVASRSTEANIGDPFSLTQVNTADVDWADLTFTDLDGNPSTVVSDNPNTIKILNVMGTWCPNCRDEMVFLKEYLGANPSLPLEITTLCYERYKDDAKNLAIIKNYKTKLDVPWSMYLGGYADKDATSLDFPFLSKILSYPTLLVIDKSNTIREIHTGFNGPATSEYATFKTKFDTLIKSLASE